MPWENRHPHRGNRTATVQRRRTVRNRRMARKRSYAASRPILAPSSTTTNPYSIAIFVPLNLPNRCATRRRRRLVGHRREMVKRFLSFFCYALKVKLFNFETFISQVNLVLLRYIHQRASHLQLMAINWKTTVPNSLVRISFRNAITV